jgi:hypothetical protein
MARAIRKLISDAITEQSGHSVYRYLLTLVHRSWISYTLKMEAIRSSETSVNKISTRRHIPEDGILQYVKMILVEYRGKQRRGQRNRSENVSLNF